MLRSPHGSTPVSILYSSVHLNPLHEPQDSSNGIYNNHCRLRAAVDEKKVSLFTV
jgi:hypothetical protein